MNKVEENMLVDIAALEHLNNAGSPLLGNGCFELLGAMSEENPVKGSASYCGATAKLPPKHSLRLQ